MLAGTHIHTGDLEAEEYSPLWYVTPLRFSSIQRPPLALRKMRQWQPATSSPNNCTSPSEPKTVPSGPWREMQKREGRRRTEGEQVRGQIEHQAGWRYGPRVLRRVPRVIVSSEGGACFAHSLYHAHSAHSLTHSFTPSFAVSQHRQQSSATRGVPVSQLASQPAHPNTPRH